MTKRKEHLRRCAGCGLMKPKYEMLRIVKSPGEEFSVDLTGKVNGRGAYLCKNQDCFEAALKNKGLNRSFKRILPESIYEELRVLITGGSKFED